MRSVREWTMAIVTLAIASVLAIILTSPAVQKQAGRLYALCGMLVCSTGIYIIYLCGIVSWDYIDDVMFIVFGAMIAVSARLLRDL